MASDAIDGKAKVLLHGVDTTSPQTAINPVMADSAGNARVSLGTRIAGEEQPDSTANSVLRIMEDWKWANVTIAQNGGIGTVYAGACRLGRIIAGATADVQVLDASVTQTMALTITTKTFTDAFHGTRILTKGQIQASASGTFAVQYREAVLT